MGAYLREVQGPAPSIELYHKATNRPIVDYQDIREAKASFLRVAESENHMVGAYVYGKEGLRHFNPVLEKGQEKIEKVQRTTCEEISLEKISVMPDESRKTEDKGFRISME